MSNPEQPSPPRWATRLLSWYCKPELLEDLHGDLNEYFERNVKTHGAKKARRIYILDVLKFFRLYTVRKPEFFNPLINFIMIGSYIKTSGRSIARSKLFSTINIIGLAISMSVGLMLIGLLSDIFSYDKFHTNHKRIYRVTTSYEYLGEKNNQPMATTSLKAGRAIKETFTMPEAVAIVRRDFEGDLAFEQKAVPLNGYMTNPDF
ncbi:MAG: permease prefix domain 2-containing transporter, partial [Cyclobacteriaceae bacterium]|nr:permease prefix domain 2-containing transporter [Cyclobacteriaceae bacterium]